MPRHAATRSDYDRVLKQRNALLKSARAGKFTAGHEATLDVWDQHMARAGAELLHARLELVDRLQPHLKNAYAQLTDGSKEAAAVYRSTLQDILDDDGERGPRPARSRTVGAAALRKTCACCRSSSSPTLYPGLRRSTPQRNWNGASRWWARTATSSSSCSDRPRPRATPRTAKPGPCACPCAWPPTTSCSTTSRTGGSAPILILDDVFAELDVQRRRKLAGNSIRRRAGAGHCRRRGRHPGGADRTAGEGHPGRNR